MNEELRETVMKAEMYNNEKNEKLSRRMRMIFLAGFFALMVNGFMDVMEIGGTFWIGFAKGATFGLAMCAMIFGFIYTTGQLGRLMEAKKRLLENVRMGLY